MLFSDRPKQLPYLSDYLQIAASRRPPIEVGNFKVGFVSLLAGAAGAVLCALAGAGLPAILAAGAASLGSYYFGAKAGGKIAALKPTDEELLLEQQSREVVLRMQALMNKRRLHRDLSPDVAAILEEAASQWCRARTALLSPYWNRSELSLHMQQVRDNSLKAAERTMMELMILFSTSVPEQPGNWNIAEVADEVLGKDIFASRNSRHMSPFFEQAITLVEQMKSLADESEQVSRQLVNDPMIGAQAKPGTALEATLSELRSIRQAEEELRQDLPA
ncbi:MAG TPA: hypothetical protein VK934_09580 [Fimbriimonas sp.]|nr:hypothetical protein [Fimbriimonas sp.]